MALLILATTGSVMDTVRDTADTFGWDPKLFFSQVISFIIVAYLLKRFAYKPILGVLEQRRQQIAQAHLNAEAQKMIEEARSSASHLADRKQQEAITAAEQILAKAREASAIEHERTMTQLKRELGRLVVETTAKVTGKVLTPDDQRRLQEEAARTFSA